MDARSSGRRRNVALAAAIGLTVAVHPSDPVLARSAPSGPAVEITITGPTVVAPGGTVSFAGTCLSGGGSTQASVYAARTAGPGITPFGFTVEIPLPTSAGTFSGSIAVPGDAPNGAYHLDLNCYGGDAVYGSAAVRPPFTVDGPVVTTTTTSTPLRATPHVDAHVAPPPATPVRGTATLTG